MHWKLSPAAQQQLILLTDLYGRIQRLHGLVEQYATAKTNPTALEGPIRRTCEQLRNSFLGAGYGAMAQLAGSMVLAVKRSGPHLSKARILREAVGSLRSQLETEQRALRAPGGAARQEEPDAE